MRGSIVSPGELALTREVFDAVSALVRENDLSESQGLSALVGRVVDDILGRLGDDADRIDLQTIEQLVATLLDYEEMFVVPAIDWPERRSVSELGALRDALKAQKALLERFDQVIAL